MILEDYLKDSFVFQRLTNKNNLKLNNVGNQSFVSYFLCLPKGIRRFFFYKSIDFDELW